jgi:outer membrane immunogenic protein
VFVGKGMKARIGAAAALLTAAGSSAAMAADVARSPHPYYSPPAYAPASLSSYSWIGPYIGVNVGYQWGRITSVRAHPHGVAGGLHGGYSWQSGQFVFGGETDLQLSAAEDTFAPWKFSNPWFGTLRGRAGIALNNILLYGTGGLAYGGLRAEASGLAAALTHFGWAAGLGMEVGFTQNISARAEYIYVDLQDRAYNLVGAQTGFESSLLRFGVNYRF